MPFIIPNTQAVSQIIDSSPVVLNGSDYTWKADRILYGVKVIHVGIYSFSAEVTSGTEASLKIVLQRNLGAGWEDQGGEVAGATLISGRDTRFRFLCKVPYYNGVEAGVLPKYRLVASCSIGEVTFHIAEGSDGIPSGMWKAEYEFQGEEAVGYLIPKTQLTVCYDPTNRAVIPCSGTGQDGEYQTGLLPPTPRYTDNGDGTLTDNLTNLIWCKDANPSTGQVFWQTALNVANAAASGSYGLTDGSSAGDWRLPNVNELRSIINYSIAGPCISNIEGNDSNGSSGTDSFINLQNEEYYWSSTSDAALNNYAWEVTTGGGSSKRSPKTSSKFMMLVKGNPLLPKTNQTTCYDSSGNPVSCLNTGQDGEFQAGVEIPSPRFSDNGDGTITDNFTNLVWMSDTHYDGSEVSWQAALDLANSTLFRLPNVNELTSLTSFLNFNPSVDNSLSLFTNLAGGYWASTVYGYNTAPSTFSWVVDMNYGTTVAESVNNINWVWLVKD